MKLKCIQCGYKWKSLRNIKPTSCANPNCRSKFWDKEKIGRLGSRTNPKPRKRKPEYHGMSTTRTYKSWMAIKERCNNKKSSGYKRYGGRGITYCERWEKFENFLKDMGERPEGSTIERINNNGNYEPENCRWATPKEQSINRSTNKTYTIKNETKTFAEWADEYGVNRATFWNRIRKGMAVDEALTKPIIKKYSNNKEFELFGIKKSAAEWARIAGITRNTLIYRIEVSGLSLTEAIVFPPFPPGTSKKIYDKKVKNENTRNHTS